MNSYDTPTNTASETGHRNAPVPTLVPAAASGQPLPHAVDIRPGDMWDVHLVALLIAQALHDLAVAQWLVPDDGERQSVLYHHFLVHAEHGLRHGYVDIASASGGATGDGRAGGARGRAVDGEGRLGVAVWHGVGEEISGPEDAGGGGRLVLGCGPPVDRIRALDEAVERHRPTEPHVHLAFLAVAPARRGQGIGTHLLRAHHHRLDQADADAYLIAVNEQARRLGQRHSYHDHGPPIQLPDGPTLWPMWREAQTPGGAT